MIKISKVKYSVKLRSFRLRIALLSSLLAGLALVGFGVVAWRLIYTAKVNRLDEKLENQLGRASRLRPQESWEESYAALVRELGTDTALFIRDGEGNTLYQSPDWTSDFLVPNLFPPLPAFPFPHKPSALFEIPARGRRSPPPKIETRFTTQPIAPDRWRIAAASFPNSQVAIAVSLQAIDQEMTAISDIFIVVIPGTLLLVAGGAWWLSNSVLRPVRQLTAIMQQLTASRLDQRLAIGTTDIEFIELIQVFNQMLERLERSFKQASRFSADAAHELKTPLAILQGELEQALQQADSGSENQQGLSNRLDEVRRLSGIVRKLLLLSLADAGQMGFHKVQVDLSEILAVMLEDLELLAPQLTVQPEIASGLQAWGDRDLITQILQNLASNAIKYNLPNGWIRIEAKQSEATVMVMVTNASNDIPAPDRDRIFDRFYRGDPARTRKVEGIGLGLSLSREIARAHGGDLILGVGQMGQTEFILSLPRYYPSLTLS
jgi:two-component system, OmpR family, heavy metal sensor histidine kinase CusS